MFVSFIQQCVEYRQLGWNAVTLSAAATLFFTGLQGWGTWKQNARLWRARSGQAVSAMLVIYSLCFFMAFLCYGVVTRSLSIVANGLLCPIFFCMFVAIVRFRRLRAGEWALLALLSGMTPVVLFTGYGEWIIVGSSLFNDLCLLDQIRKLARTRQRGDVDIRMAVSFDAACAFWTIYGFACGNVFFAMSFLSFFAMWTTIIVLWFRAEGVCGER